MKYFYLVFTVITIAVVIGFWLDYIPEKSFLMTIPILTGIGGILIGAWITSMQQRQGMITSLTNEARITLTEAIRDFQDWCAEINAGLGSMPVDDIISQDQSRDQRRKKRDKIRQLTTDQIHFMWLRRLEEYEPLFPGTAQVRIDMMHILRKITETARKLADQHGTKSTPLKEELDSIGRSITDIMALSWDLLIYLQNTSIGQITGNKIPERKPIDSNAIRLETDRKGLLVIRKPD